MQLCSNLQISELPLTNVQLRIGVSIFPSFNRTLCSFRQDEFNTISTIQVGYHSWKWVSYQPYHCFRLSILDHILELQLITAFPS